jgi:Na+/phosphate symporter
MDEKEHVRVIAESLDSFGKTIDDLKKCLFSRDKRRTKETVKAFYTSLNLSLPVFDEIMERAEKNETDRKLLSLLPMLQQIGIATQDLVGAIQTAVDAEVSLTDRALAEISEVMSLLKDLARDTNDVLNTGNEHFCKYVLASAERIQQRVDECAVEHQQRLIIGVCTPKASFLYLDVIHSLKRLAQELARLCEAA